MIRQPWMDHIRVLLFAVFVSRAKDRGAMAVAEGFRLQARCGWIDGLAVGVSVRFGVGFGSVLCLGQ
jgi:hypothetical protein